MNRRAFALRAGALGALVLGNAAARAETYPAKPIRLVVGYAPGAQSDAIGRLAALRLGALLDTSVIVENRPGANGTIGLDSVARSPADGYTLALAGGGSLTLAPVLDRNVRFDAQKDFAPLARLARVPLVLAARQGLPVKNAAQLLEHARRHPGRLTYGAGGASAQLAIELLKVSTGIDVLTVNYKGTAPALLDVLAGRVDLVTADASAIAPHVSAGTLRPIACLGTTRARAFPNLPTLAEQGIAGVEMESWQGLVAPAGTPPEILRALRSALRRMRTASDFREELDRLGFEPIDEDPEAFAAVVREEGERFRALVARLGPRAFQ